MFLEVAARWAMKTNFQIAMVLAILVATAATGCVSPAELWKKDFKLWKSEPEVTESKFESPERMVVIWSPAMYSEPGKKPTRGFGGRIYFYGKMNNPIAVEGQLVVNAYDDSQSEQKASQAPDRRYAFPQETFSSHFAPTDLGPSYSVWVPWDEVGGIRKQISLVPVFTASSGKVVMAQQSRNLLPGSEEKESEPPTPQLTNLPKVYSDSSVKQISYEEQVPTQMMGAVNVTHELPGDSRSVHEQLLGTTNPTTVSSTPPKSLRATSIHVPSSLAERMAVAPTGHVRTQTLATAPAFQQQQVMPPTGANVAVEMTPQVPMENRSPLSSSTVGRRSALGQGVPRPWTPPDPRSTRYQRQPLPVPSSPNLQPVGDLQQMPLLPAG